VRAEEKVCCPCFDTGFSSATKHSKGVRIPMTQYILLLHCPDCGMEEFMRTFSKWQPRLDLQCGVRMAVESNEA